MLGLLKLCDFILHHFPWTGCLWQQMVHSFRESADAKRWWFFPGTGDLGQITPGTCQRAAAMMVQIALPRRQWGIRKVSYWRQHFSFVISRHTWKVGVRESCLACINVCIFRLAVSQSLNTSSQLKGWTWVIIGSTKVCGQVCRPFSAEVCGIRCVLANWCHSERFWEICFLDNGCSVC